MQYDWATWAVTTTLYDKCLLALYKGFVAENIVA